jgi:23S rRNA (cytidine1920-2'-O)/16S rRNA (cytidine1409-2'-O)-methyltransferase
MPRLDVLLHQRGLTPSREKAQALILAGQVLVDHQKSDKPGRSVPDDALIELLGQVKYVSRGGLKLEAALDHFGIDPAGLVCLDVGTSTGGFTDCLLQRGARKVHAVDVGASQMNWTLRQDPRVQLHEHTNARHLTTGQIGEPVDLAVCDVSFISVTLLIENVAQCLRPEGRGW